MLVRYPNGIDGEFLPEIHRWMRIVLYTLRHVSATDTP